MSDAKEELIKLIEGQPEDSSVEEIAREILFLPYGKTWVGRRRCREGYFEC